LLSNTAVIITTTITITDAVFPELAAVLQGKFGGQTEPQFHSVAQEAEVGGGVVVVREGVVGPPHVP